MRLPSTAVALLVTACYTVPRPTAPSKQIHWTAIETGMGCATAQVACGRGNCAANLRNHCEEPITCQLTVQSVCRAYTGESGEAIGRSRDTFARGDGGGILARVICADGEVEVTHAKELTCRRGEQASLH